MLVRVALRLVLAFTGAAVVPSVAVSQTVLPPSTVTSNGVYVWIDGSYRSVSLPSYSLGLHGFDLGTTFLDTGPIQSFKPRVSGYGVNGGFGYALPQGSVPAVFGNVRVGLTASFVGADANQSGAATVSNVPTGVFLDGTSVMLCGCMLSSTLATRYSNWRAGLNVASDVQSGSVLWTRSVELIGGHARTKQSLFQIDDDESYTADTKLRWTDIGARIGLNATMPFSGAVEFGVGGTLAIVHRHVNFSGSDLLEVFGLTTIPGNPVASSANTWAVVPSLQAQFVYRLQRQTTIRLYGGVEWDNRVPGIVSPSFTVQSLFGGTPGTPASIGFSSEASYFIGGGMTYAFNQ